MIKMISTNDVMKRSLKSLTRIKASSFFLFYFGVNLGILVLAILWMFSEPHGSTAQMFYAIVMLAANDMIFVGWPLYEIRKNKIPLRDVLNLSAKLSPFLTTFGTLIALMMLNIGIFALADAVSQTLSGQPVLAGEDLAELAAKIPKILTVISFVFIAPIFEELIFRGILLPSWSKRYGVKKALIGTSVLFGLLHLNLIFLPYFFLGLFFGVVYLRKKNLLSTIILHMTNNAIATSFMLFSSSPSPETPATHEELTSIAIIGVAMIAIGSIIFFSYLKRHWPRKLTV